MRGERVESKFPEEEVITSAVIRMNALMTGTILGLLFGLILFVATNWLVIRGGETPGQHLQLLAQYFPGYTVTFLGSIIGFFWAFLVGFLSGLLLGSIYNKLAR
jgi:hypothetical protein